MTNFLSAPPDLLQPTLGVDLEVFNSKQTIAAAIALPTKVLFETYIRPEEPDRIPEEVFVRKLGITKEQLLDVGLSLEKFRQVYNDLTDNRTTVAYNACWDSHFLGAKIDFDAMKLLSKICGKRFFSRANNYKYLKLVDAKRLMDLPFPGRPHEAGADAQAVAMLFHKIRHGIGAYSEQGDFRPVQLSLDFAYSQGRF